MILVVVVLFDLESNVSKMRLYALVIKLFFWVVWAAKSTECLLESPDLQWLIAGNKNIHSKVEFLIPYKKRIINISAYDLVVSSIIIWSCEDITQWFYLMKFVDELNSFCLRFLGWFENPLAVWLFLEFF